MPTREMAEHQRQLVLEAVEGLFQEGGWQTSRDTREPGGLWLINPDEWGFHVSVRSLAITED